MARYWVGGTAAWDGTAGTKWATTSGGAGGASIPNSTEDVFFDAASTGTCTISTGNTGAKSINCTGFTGTLAGSAAITVAGSFILDAAQGFTYTGLLTITGTGTVTTSGKSLGATLTIQGAGITVTLGSALTITTGSGVFLTSGTFDTAGYNMTLASGINSNNSNVRTINLNSSTVTITGGAGSVALQTTTNLTFNAGTSTIALNADNTQINAASTAGSGVTFYNVSCPLTSVASHNFIGNNTYNNITVTAPSSAGVKTINFFNGVVINGTLSTTGTAGNCRVWFRGATYGLAQTLTINSTPSLTDADFRDIYVIGTAAPISGTRVGDLRGCRGITFDAPKTVYWVTAAGGNWSGNNWAASSGGAASTNNFPLAQDTATIENTGLNTSATVTMDNIIAYTGTVDMSSRTNAMTLSLATGYAIYGDWKNGSGTTLSGAQTLTFSGRSTQTITSAGKAFSGGITVDSYGGSVELADALNIGSSSITVNNGTFDTKNYNVTVTQFNSSNSNVRSIFFGSSTLTFSNSAGIDFTTSTNLTFNSGTSTINHTHAGNPSFSGGGNVFYSLNFTATNAATCTINGANTFNDITVTAPSSAGFRQLSLSANQTITGTLTVAGASPVRRIFVRSDTLGTTRTLTVGTLSADDCDFRDITIAGSAAGSSPTRAGDCGGNSGITFPAPKTVYWNLASTSTWFGIGWCPTSGGTPDINSFPLAQDTAVFDDAGSATTVNPNVTCNIGTIDMSARTTAITSQFGACSIYGNVILSSALTITASGTGPTFSGRSTQTITSNGITFNNPITVDCVTGTVQLADALSLGSTRTLTLTSGTFDAVSYNVTVGLFTNGATVNNTLKIGSGTWTLSGTGAVWTIISSTITFYKGTANIVLSDTSTTARTFAGGSLSYNKLTIGGTTGTSTTTITGNNQFTELASTKTVAHTIALGTTTQTFGKWSVTGTVGNVVTLTGTGTNHVIAGSATSGIDYLAMGSIGFSATSPGEFYAGANSTGTAAAPVYRTAPPAARTLYWVGGTGNWSDTARWSTSSGGASGAAVPTSLDDVVFDSLSNATAYTSTVNANSRCNTLTIAGPLVGDVTLAGSSALIIHDDVTLPATGLTRTYTGNITFSGSTSGKTLTTNGVQLASIATVNGVGCEWTLGSAVDTQSTFTVTNGSFKTANYTFSIAALSSTLPNDRTIELGSSTINTNATAGINLTNIINLTFNAGTSQINLSAGGSLVSAATGLTFYNVSFTSTALTTPAISGQNTFNNLTIAGRITSGISPLSLTANQTITGTFTCSAGTDATMRTFVRSNTIGTTRTLTCNAVSLTDVDFRDITIAGAAAPATGTRIGDCKGNSGITFDAAANKYWNLATGGNWGGAIGWATSSGGTPAINNFPLAQDTCYFEATGLNSGATISMNADYNVGTVDMSARTSNTMIFATSNRTIPMHGNWINGTGVSVTNAGLLFFVGRGAQTLTSAGVVFAPRLTVESPGGSLTLQDAYASSNSSTGAVTLVSGTLDANNYNVTLASAGTFTVSGTATRTVAVGSGTWTSSGIGSAWDAVTPTNLTVTGTGTISLTSASSKAFTGGGVDYSGITLNQGGAGTMSVGGNNTFANITNTYSATGATTIAFGTTTQRVGSFTATGEAGRVLTLTGSSASSPATLVLTSGTVTTPDYLTITGIRAYNLTTTWYAGANSTNNGSLGWYFEAAGGTTFNVSFSDTATGADAVSASFAFNAAFSDTATGADAVSAGLAFNVSFSDTATGADAVSVAASTFGAAFSDTATGTDAVSATGTFNVSLSELATGADAFSTTTTLGVSFSDAATGADAVSTTATLDVAFSDTATGADALSTSFAFSASFSDTASGADAFSAAATLNVSLSELATGADAVSAAATLNVSVSDAASGQDTPAVAASTFNASFSASATGQDTPAPAGSTFNVSLSETGAITDVVVGGYLWNPVDDTQSANWQNVVTAQSPGWVQINDAQGPNWVEIQT